MAADRVNREVHLFTDDSNPEECCIVCESPRCQKGESVVPIGEDQLLQVWKEREPSDLPAVAMSPRDLIAMSHTDVSEGCPEGMYLSYLPLTVWPGPRACRAPGIHTPRGVPLVIGLTYGWPWNMHFSFYVRLLLVDCHFL